MTELLWNIAEIRVALAEHITASACTGWCSNIAADDIHNMVMNSYLNSAMLKNMADFVEVVVESSGPFVKILKCRHYANCALLENRPSCKYLQEGVMAEPLYYLEVPSCYTVIMYGLVPVHKIHAFKALLDLYIWLVGNAVGVRSITIVRRQ